MNVKWVVKMDELVRLQKWGSFWIINGGEYKLQKKQAEGPKWNQSWQYWNVNLNWRQLVYTMGKVDSAQQIAGELTQG